MKYSIPELLSKIGIRGYMPQAAAALNRALRAKSEIEYSNAIKEAVELLTESQTVNYGNSSFFEGVPLWLPILLEHHELGEILLENAIVEIKKSKHIITTPVISMEGTVKEYISNGDWQIQVKGILASKNYHYPREQYLKLLEFLNFHKPLNVVNQWLNDAQIYSLVITDFSLPYNPHINCVIYEFNALSDKPIELLISNENV